MRKKTDPDNEKTPNQLYRENCIFTHEIAKQICERAREINYNYNGALELAEMAAGQIREARNRATPRVLDYATGRYADKIVLPDNETPGKGE